MEKNSTVINIIIKTFEIIFLLWIISSEPRVKKITFSDKIAALAHIFPINDHDL